MRDQGFWRLIDRARRGRLRQSGFACGCGETGRIVYELRRLVARLPVREQIGFHRAMRRIYHRANRWELWTAFGMALGGANHACFRNGICWLVLQGKRRFAKVVNKPDTLAGLNFDRDDLLDAEEMSGIVQLFLDPREGVPEKTAVEALEDLHGFLGFVSEMEEPRGEQASEDVATLRLRYPKLTAKHIPAGTRRLARPAVEVPQRWCPGLANQTGAPS